MGCCSGSSIKVKERKIKKDEIDIINQDENNNKEIKNENNDEQKKEDEIIKINKKNKNKNNLNENKNNKINPINNKDETKKIFYQKIKINKKIKMIKILLSLITMKMKNILIYLIMQI